MTIKEQAPGFSLELLQAINDWQLGGNRRRKKTDGLRLKRLASALDPQFRRCDLVCYRRVALDKASVWILGDTLHLKEEISSWTSNLDVAKNFKGGVPPKGWQGVVFAFEPSTQAVVLNLAALYRDPTFLQECKRLSSKIRNFSSGIGYYGDSEEEIILDIPELNIRDVYALGGYSSDRLTLARAFSRQLYRREPTARDLQYFDTLLQRTGEQLGPAWIHGVAKDRVLGKILAAVEKLRPYAKKS
jgi:hypothetical protein